MDTPDEISRYHDGKTVFVHGTVEDATAFRLQSGITIVPLLSGSGVRIKIMEALALARPVVSTSLGAEGLLLENGRDLKIADGIEPFAEATLALMRDAVHANQLGRQGRATVEHHYASERMAMNLVEILHQLIEGDQSRP